MSNQLTLINFEHLNYVHIYDVNFSELGNFLCNFLKVVDTSSLVFSLHKIDGNNMKIYNVNS